MEVEAEAPAVGSMWLHKNGNTYMVAVITNICATKTVEYPLTVVYFNPTTDTWWSRPVSRWHDSMTLLPKQ